MNRPLDGITVIDASTIIAGPLAATLLGDYGARVIKLEHPDGGDKARRNGAIVDGHGSWWTFLSRNKESVTCDVSTSRGAELFARLTSRADLLVENFRPGRLERWGVGPAVLQERNPRLAILRVSGFGQDGPYATRTAYGTVVEALTGFVNMNGYAHDRPLLPGIPVADHMTGIMGAFAAMVALRSRDSMGRAPVVDLSLYGPMLQAMGIHLTEYGRTGKIATRNGNRMGASPRNTQQCSDGRWVSYAVGQSHRIVQQLVDLLGLMGDRRFSDPESALINGDDLDRAIGVWINSRSQGDVIAAFSARGIPIGPVNNAAEVLTDDHFTARNEFGAYRDGECAVALPDTPFRVSGTAPRSCEVGATAPELGQHNQRVYRDLLGVSDDELDTLKTEGII